MPWRGEEYEGEFPSLGWAALDLAEEYCRMPTGGPLVPTTRQAQFIVRLYRIDPETGRFVYRRGVDEGAKGVGKSPEGAIIGFFELVGGVVFDGWDSHGDPVGIPRYMTDFPALVQVIAAAESQTDNLYGYLVQMLAESPALDEFGLDVRKAHIVLKDKPGKLEPQTTAAGTREGARVTCSLHEETQHWHESNGGWAVDAVQRRNVAKTGGRTVALTNAPMLGQQSIAESDMASARKGERGLLYQAVRGDMVEDLNDRGAVLASLRQAYAENPDDPNSPAVSYVDLERLADECADPAIPPGTARRFYLNIPDDTPDDCWIDRRDWVECKSDAVIPDGAEVFLGVDVAIFRDNTAVAVVWRDPDGQFVTRVRTWDPKDSGGQLDVTDVMQHIRELADLYEVRECVYDPRFFDVPAKMLADEGIPMVELPQSSTFMVPACGFAYEQIRSRNVAHDGDPILEVHVMSAQMRHGESGWTLSKSKSKHVIDACIAMVMAMYRCGQPEQDPPSFLGAYL